MSQNERSVGTADGPAREEDVSNRGTLALSHERERPGGRQNLQSSPSQMDLPGMTFMRSGRSTWSWTSTFDLTGFGLFPVISDLLLQPLVRAAYCLLVLLVDPLLPFYPPHEIVEVTHDQNVVKRF